MKKISIGSKEVIHFIGIGGIGMSGLAQIMKVMGFKIQGSDINTNRNIDNCKKLKIKVYIGHKKHNLNKATIIVKSGAIKKIIQKLFMQSKTNSQYTIEPKCWLMLSR